MEIVEPKNFLKRHLASFALIGGFVFDYFTLWRIDLLQEELIFIFYIIFSAFCIWQLSKISNETSDRVKNFFLFALQFCFGGLIGRFFIFYSMSGTFYNSWPFLLSLALLFVLNERLRDRYELFLFRIIVYFIVLFSFLIFFLPILIGSMSALVFLLSGAVSLFLIIKFSRFLSRISELSILNKAKLYFSIAFIFVLINALYFTNLIPPIPLALINSGVYASVERHTTSKGIEYVASEEAIKLSWLSNHLLFQTKYVNIKSGEALYFYSSVFAPTRIKTDISHCWQFYNQSIKDWQTKPCVTFPISGGASGGYRGYSIKYAPEAGLWKVNVQTSRGQIIGSEKFEVVYSTSTVNRIEKIL